MRVYVFPPLLIRLFQTRLFLSGNVLLPVNAQVDVTDAKSCHWLLDVCLSEQYKEGGLMPVPEVASVSSVLTRNHTKRPEEVDEENRLNRAKCSRKLMFLEDAYVNHQQLLFVKKISEREQIIKSLQMEISELKIKHDEYCQRLEASHKAVREFIQYDLTVALEKTEAKLKAYQQSQQQDQEQRTRI